MQDLQLGVFNIVNFGKMSYFLYFFSTMLAFCCIRIIKFYYLEYKIRQVKQLLKEELDFEIKDEALSDNSRLLLKDSAPQKAASTTSENIHKINLSNVTEEFMEIIANLNQEDEPDSLHVSRQSNVTGSHYLNFFVRNILLILQIADVSQLKRHDCLRELSCINPDSLEEALVYKGGLAFEGTKSQSISKNSKKKPNTSD